MPGFNPVSKGSDIRTLLTRLSAARAALLDNLDALISSRQATLTFERYYYGTLAIMATYTPAVSGLFSAAVTEYTAFLRAEYFDGTGWRYLKHGRGVAEDEPYALEFAIGDGANFRLANTGIEYSLDVVVMRVS